MVLADLLRNLKEHGFGKVRPNRIHYAIRAGYVEQPPLNGSLSYEFGSRHVRQIEAYLRNPPRRGPKPQSATAN